MQKLVRKLFGTNKITIWKDSSSDWALMLHTKEEWVKRTCQKWLYTADTKAFLL